MVLKVRVLTSTRVICTTTADEVILPGLTGQVGVLEGHATLVTALDTGLLRIKLDGKWTPIILCGGLAEIDRNQVTVLANEVEEIIDVNLNTATSKLEEATIEAEKMMSDSTKTSKERLQASDELKKAMARCRAINYLS